MSEENKELSNGEIIDKFNKTIEELKTTGPDPSNELPIETEFLRKSLAGAVLNYQMLSDYQVKLLYNKAFNLPEETMEIQQLHLNQSACDKRFTAIEHDLSDELREVKSVLQAEITENRRDNKITRYALIAVTVIFTGFESLPEILRLLGFA